jgi:hypothetical protein
MSVVSHIVVSLGTRTVCGLTSAAIRPAAAHLAIRQPPPEYACVRQGRGIPLLAIPDIAVSAQLDRPVVRTHGQSNLGRPVRVPLLGLMSREGMALA